MACIVKYKWTKITDVQKSLRSVVQKGINNIDIDNRQESFLIEAINNFKENAPEYSQDNIDTFNRAIQQNDDSIKNLLGENGIDYGTYVYLLKLISSILNKGNDEIDISKLNNPNTVKIGLVDTSNNATQQIRSTYYEGSDQIYNIKQRRLFQDFMQTCIFNRENGYQVVTNEDLNNRIIEYKNKLFYTISSYLRRPATLYYSGVLNSVDYISVMSDISTQINNALDNGELNRKMNNDPEFLEAMNAFINLAYFDDYVDEICANLVVVNPKCPHNQESTISTNVNKYIFAKVTGHYNRDFTKNNDDGVRDMGNIARMVISTLDISGNVANTAMTPVQFSASISKLINGVLLYSSSSPQVLRLQSSIIRFHNNPQFYSRAILMSLFNSNNQDGEQTNSLQSTLISEGIVNQQDIEVLKSIYNNIFNLDEEYKSYLYAETQSARENRASAFSRVAISDCISNYINSIVLNNINRTIFNEGGQVIMNIANKTASKKAFYNIYNAINNSMQIPPIQWEGLVNKYKIDSDENGRILVKDGAVIIKINNDVSIKLEAGSRSLLAHNLNGLKVTIFSSDPSADYTKVNLMDSNIIESLAQGRKVSGDQKVLFDILSFIGETLGLDFTSRSGLQVLSLYQRNYQVVNKRTNSKNYLDQIIMSAIQKVIMANVIRDYDKRDNDGQLLYSFMQSEYPELISNFKEFNYYFNTVNGVSKYKLVGYDTRWIDELADQQNIYNGDTAKSTVNDQSGNKQANFRISNLGGNIFNYISDYYIEDLRRTSNDELPTAAGALAFTRDKTLLTNIISQVDVKLSTGEVKKVTNMNSGELIYNAMFINFFSAFLGVGRRDGITGSYKNSVLLQPATYADKTTLISYGVDVTEKIFNPNSWESSQFQISKLAQHTDPANPIHIIPNGAKSLATMTAKELVKYGVTTIGQFYRNSLNATIELYQKLFDDAELESCIAEIQKIINSEQSNGNIDDIKNDIAQRIIAQQKKAVAIIESKLGSYSREELINLAQSKNLEIIDELHYRQGKGGVLHFNEDLLYEATIGSATVENFTQTLEYAKQNFVQDLLQLGLPMDIIHKRSETVYKSSLYGILTNSEILKLITEDQLRDIYENWLTTPIKLNSRDNIKRAFDALDNSSYNSLIIAKIKRKNGTIDVLYDGDNINLNEGDTLMVNPLIEKYFYIDSIMSNNIRLTLVGTEAVHPVKVKLGTVINKSQEELAKIYEQQSQYNQQLQHNNTTDTLDFIINDNGKYKVNDRPNMISFLLNFGQFSNSKELFDYGMLVLRYTQNSLQGTQAKRNVIIPATLKYSLAGGVKSMADTAKFAVFDDLPAEVYDINGGITKEDGNDGSIRVMAEQALLETWGLCDNPVGQNKKPIWHHYDSVYGSAFIAKCASYAVNNETMLASLGSSTNLYNLYKRSTNIRWDDSINLIKTNASNINNSLSRVLSSCGLTGLYYHDFASNDYKQIEDLNYVEVDGKTYYYTQESIISTLGDYYALSTNTTKFRVQLFDENNEPKSILIDAPARKTSLTIDPSDAQRIVAQGIKDAINENKLEGLHTISCIFELWQALGGLQSVSKSTYSTEFTKQSEDSHLATAAYMNMVTKKREESTEIPFGLKEKLSQNLNGAFITQPLKDLLIGYAANKSAIKEGAANINSAKVWDDASLPIHYMTVKTKGWGVQMDPDQNIANEELTEFTQVMSALESNGNYHEIVKEIYSNLKSIVIAKTKSQLDAVSKYIQLLQPNSVTSQEDLKKIQFKLYDIAGDTFIDTFKSNPNSLDLSEPILNKIKDTFNIKRSDHSIDDYLLPFSDHSLYSQILPTIVGQINMDAIKRKYPGGGMVMNPSYGTAQIYHPTPNISMTYSDLYQFAKDLIKIKKIFIPLADKQGRQGLVTVTSYIDSAMTYLRNLLNHNLGIVLKQEYKLSNYEDFYDTISSIEDGDNKKQLMGQLNTLRKVSNYQDSLFTKINAADIDKYPEDSSSYVEDMRNKVSWVLDILQRATPMQAKESFIPTDIVKVSYTVNGIPSSMIFDLSSIKDYYDFTGTDTKTLIAQRLQNGTTSNDIQDIIYQQDIIKPRQLRPARITFDFNTAGDTYISMNIFDIAEIKDQLRANANDGTNGRVDKEVMRTILRNLDQGFIDVPESDGTKTRHKIRNLKYERAEALISNLYKDVYHTKDKSLYQILKGGNSTFTYNIKRLYQYNPRVIQGLDPSHKFDMIFYKSDGRHTIVTSDSQSINSYAIKSKTPKYKQVEGSTLLQAISGEQVLYDYGYLEENDKVTYNEQNKVFRDSTGRVAEGKFLIQNINGNNVVYEIKPFVEQYTCRDSNGSKITIFKINKANVDKHYGDQAAQAIANIYSSLYNMGNRTISTDAAYVSFKLGNISEPLKEIIGKMKLSGLAEQLRTEYVKVFEQDGFNGLSDNSKWSRLRAAFNASAREQATAIRSSFQKSLEIISSRIPAQELQSFMTMQVVGFLQSDLNKVEVSPWQTYLQGSDYDIDKAYIMGYSFDSIGKYKGWSNLFDYSSLATITASETLPLPTGRQYSSEDKVSISISDALAKYYPINKSNGMIMSDISTSQFIRLISRILYDTKDSTVNSITADETRIFDKTGKDVTKDEMERIVQALNTHESTKLSPFDADEYYKNSVTAKIQVVSNGIKNFALSYSPIEMTSLRKASETSPIGSQTSQMVLYNPYTKYMLQVQALVGKDVIGIAAVGAKTFYNLSFYYNEKYKDPNNRNLDFVEEYSRIARDENGNLIPVVRNRIANVNCPLDVDKGRLIQILRSAGKDFAQFIGEADSIISSTDRYYAGLKISELLSAATDNAKELILDKINCDSTYAGMYLFLIMMGFNLSDIIHFMTSPAALIIAKFSKSNIFSRAERNINTFGAINMARGNGLNPDMLSILDTSESDEVDPADAFYTQADYEDSNAKWQDQLKDALGLDEDFPSKYVLRQYIKEMVCAEDAATLNSLIKKKDSVFSDSSYAVFNNKLDSSIRKIKQAVQTYVENSNGTMSIEDAYDNYMKDIDEFEKVYNQAKEMQNLGGIFLHMNQGIPTQEQDLLQTIYKIQNIVKEREQSLYIFVNEKTKSEDIVKKIVRLHPYFNNDYVRNIVEAAIASGICGNFDAYKWIRNDDVYVNNTKHSYRDLTTKYYNLIKATTNIFDVARTSPHYNEYLNLLRNEVMIDLSLSAKSQAIHAIIKDRQGEVNFFGDDVNRIAKYVEGLIVRKWLLSKKFKFTLPANSILFNSYFMRQKNENPTQITIENDATAGTFKSYFESILFPELQRGMINGEPHPALVNNALIKNCILSQDDGMSVIKLSLNMINAKDNINAAQQLQEIIKGLHELDQVKIDGTSLVDYFIIYNFITNKNQPGINRLTTIFKDYVTKGSLLTDFFKYIGQFDSESNNVNLDKDTLYRTLDINDNDLIISVAKEVPSEFYGKVNKLWAFKVRDRKTGLFSYFKKTYNGKYVKIDNKKIVPGYDSLQKSEINQVIDDKANFSTFGSQFADFNNNIQNTINNLKSKDEFDDDDKAQLKFVILNMIQNKRIVIEKVCK